MIDLFTHGSCCGQAMTFHRSVIDSEVQRNVAIWCAMWGCFSTSFSRFINSFLFSDCL